MLFLHGKETITVMMKIIMQVVILMAVTVVATMSTPNSAVSANV